MNISKLLDELVNCSTDDICKLVDSGIFNDIIEAFLKKSIKNAGFNNVSERKVINELRFIFDENTTKELLTDKSLM